MIPNIKLREAEKNGKHFHRRASSSGNKLKYNNNEVLCGGALVKETHTLETRRCALMNVGIMFQAPPTRTDILLNYHFRSERMVCRVLKPRATFKLHTSSTSPPFFFFHLSCFQRQHEKIRMKRNAISHKPHRKITELDGENSRRRKHMFYL